MVRAGEHGASRPVPAGERQPVRISIRPASPADAATIAAVRAESWRSAYAGVIPADILGRLTSPALVDQRAQAMRDRWPAGMLIAEELMAEDRADAGAGSGSVAAVGFANFGREREPVGESLTAAPGGDPSRAELYAIYVLPRYWSAGAGLALMTEVLRRAKADGYGTLSLWVLERNARARRFYERAGFGQTGHSQVLESLGGVTELRYEMRLA